MSETMKHNEHPNLTPDRNVESGVKDSFPASDAAASTATQGTRAVSPEEMMKPHGQKPADSVTVTQSYPDAERAKLALEHLVRAGPIDRHCTEIRGSELLVHLPPGDVDRVKSLLQAA